MKKEDLRKVEVFSIEKNYIENEHGKVIKVEHIKRTLFKGFFHQWITRVGGDIDGTFSSAWGLVEKEDGTMEFHSYRSIKFVD